ncbi:NAD(P)-dependent oxidoreductase [Pseudomaricurvus alkylphenolicus]|uniref:NAD(P)-dependent oxidoreductase n=1 Tax=Pseudomaricurvus alkylphenolicus TaxID=1306991 RepID=UPI001421E231|nr:NAD(P)-dependent oxidoreductase [Pseudomaricurvus alkylphenolicus]NIB40713.1 NAD(P)-dependent oxidoreductase [Pseudomaricurvus alkylphenolicus]
MYLQEKSVATHRIGFIGIGLMGSRMVSRLLGAGYTVHVWNRTPEKAKALVAEGAVSAKDVEELVTGSDVVMLCLSETDAVETMAFGENGIVHYGTPGKVLVDFSSIHPQKSKDFAEHLQQQCGMQWIDAPVSGGTAGAENGSLIIMAGGDEKTLKNIRPVFDPLCQRLTHMGGPGSGQMTKVCNQMVVANNALVIAEMMALGRSAGVDVAKLPEALAGGFADSIPFQILAPQMADHDFTLKWKVATLLKDLNLGVDLADGEEQRVPMSLRGVELLKDHAIAGNADRDLSTLITIYEDEKG